MAFFAFNEKMLAQQGEGGFCMVKPGFFPVLLVMAALALFSFLPPVLVILLMARVALGIELVLVYIAFMTTAAFHCFMFAKQGIFG